MATDVRRGAARWVPDLEGSTDLDDPRPMDWPETLPVAHPPEWVLPTTHPSAVLRTEDRATAYDALVADLRVAAGLL